MLKRIVLETLAITVLAVCLALTVNALRENRVPLWGAPPPTPVLESDGGVLIIDLAAAQEAFNSKAALFIDARSAEDYQAGHIPGALSLPMMAFDENIEAFLTTVAPETALITYCEGPQCPLAHELAQQLALAGFLQVAYLQAGWMAWQQQGLPTATGAQPLPQQ